LRKKTIKPMRDFAEDSEITEAVLEQV